jgi:hypothetical protein
MITVNGIRFTPFKNVGMTGDLPQRHEEHKESIRIIHV